MIDPLFSLLAAPRLELLALLQTRHLPCPSCDAAEGFGAPAVVPALLYFALTVCLAPLLTFDNYSIAGDLLLFGACNSTLA